MSLAETLQSTRVQRLALGASAFAVAVLLLLTIQNTAAPNINLEYGDTSIRFSADRSWTLYPGDCVNLSWDLEGIQSLYINDYGRIGRDEMTFCPAINATSSIMEVTAQNGVYRRLELEIRHLPDLIFYVFGFVGLLGSGLLSLYFLNTFRLDRPLPVAWFLTVLNLLLISGGAIRLSPVMQPLIDEDDGSVAVRFWAERGSLIFPHECVEVGWSVSGAQSLTYKGQDVTMAGNPGMGTHCAGDGVAATLDVISSDGASRRYTLEIHSLFPESQQQPGFIYWSLLVLIISFIVFAPLVVQSALTLRPRFASPDFVAVIGCILFVFALFAPLGYDSIAHWENQILRAYIEGGSLGFLAAEFVSRFMAPVFPVLSYALHTESFLGNHLVNCLTLAGLMVAVYGIMRRLKIASLYAFLVAALFTAYPVNSMLLSMRSMPLNISKLSLFVAIYFILDFKRNPRRLALVGCWLALLHNVATYETAYPLILLIPALWWLTRPTSFRRNVTLTCMWYLIPLFKGAYTILLYATGRDFYQSGLLRGGSQTQATIQQLFAAVIEAMREVISYTFVEGWREAFNSTIGDVWWASILLPLAIVGGVAWYLVRQSDPSQCPAGRDIGRSVLIGFLLVPASVVALLWLPLYANDLWRPFLYVPLGASIALFGVLLAATKRIRNFKYRERVLIALCLALLIPALSRLQLQGRGHVQSADRKAKILHNVLEIAPRLEPSTQLLIVTPMENEALQQLGIFEFIHWDMINSAFYVLYGSEAPERAYFCLSWRICSTKGDEETIFDSDAPGELLQRTLVFKLNEDLSLELIDDPVSELALDLDIRYDASTLYDPDAPLPPRAESMLGPAIRR